ncbi:MAG: hypothetical protein ACK4S4_05065 [Pyrinomonadaceae bacterium]
MLKLGGQVTKPCSSAAATAATPAKKPAPVPAATPAKKPAEFPKGWWEFDEARDQFNKREFSRALAAVNKAIAAAPNNESYRFLRARIYLGLRKTDEAVEDLENVIMLANEVHPEAYALGASIGFERKEYEPAMQALGEAIKTAEMLQETALRAKYLAYRAGFNGMIGRHDARYDDLTKAKSLGVPSAAELNAEGWGYLYDGAYGMALLSAWAARLLDTKAAEPYTIAGVAYARLGDQAMSLAAFNDGLKLDPNYGIGHVYRGNLLFYMKSYDRSIEAVNKGLPLLTKKDASIERLAYQTLAWSHCALGQKNEAAKFEAELVKRGGKIESRCAGAPAAANGPR